MRNKLIYCIPLALSITCLIGCAAKAAQMPAEPEPVALLPEQEQSSIVTNDARNETIPTPQQSEHNAECRMQECRMVPKEQRVRKIHSA